MAGAERRIRLRALVGIQDHPDLAGDVLAGSAFVAGEALARELVDASLAAALEPLPAIAAAGSASKAIDTASDAGSAF